MLKLYYWDAKTNRQVEIPLDAVSNCVLIKVPAQNEQPEVKVHVNDDAVIVQADNHPSPLGSLVYTDLLADAAAE